MESPNADIVIELNQLIVQHIDDLWTIAAALIVIEIVMIAHVLHGHRVSFSNSRIAQVLFVSAFLNGLTVVFGYLGKAAIIVDMSNYASAVRRN